MNSNTWENIGFSLPSSLFPSGLILISWSPHFSLSLSSCSHSWKLNVSQPNNMTQMWPGANTETICYHWFSTLLEQTSSCISLNIVCLFSISLLILLRLLHVTSFACSSWVSIHTLAGRSFFDGAWSPGVCGVGPPCFYVCVWFAVLHDLAGFLLLILCWYWHSEVE